MEVNTIRDDYGVPPIPCPPRTHQKKSEGVFLGMAFPTKLLLKSTFQAKLGSSTRVVADQ